MRTNYVLSLVVYALVTGTLLSVTACGKDVQEEIKEEIIINIDQVYFSVPCDESNVQVHTASNVELTCVIDDKCTEWIHYVEKDNDVFHFQVMRNEGLEHRRGVIYFRYNDVVKDVVIIQKPFEPSIVLSKTQYRCSYFPSEIQVEITTNVPFEFRFSHDWLQLYGDDEHGYTVSIAQNDTEVFRVAEMELVNHKYDISTILRVEQTPYNTYYVEAGNLKNMIVAEQIQDKSNIILYGCLNRDDFLALNNIAGLRNIDILNCSCVANEIPENAFKNNSSLESIRMPQSITCINDQAFSGCVNIQAIEIPRSVKKIGVEIFRDCRSLEIVSFVSDCELDNLSRSMFVNCNKLRSISIPVSIKSIGFNCFRNCSSLLSIELCDNIEFIGSQAFMGCSSITSIKIPQKIVEIYDHTFSGCSLLSDIRLHDGIIRIAGKAFQDCVSLEQIDFPNSIEYMADMVFDGCRLRSVVIPPLLTTLSWYLFCGCLFEEITIPERVTYINRSFSECYNLKKVICLATIPPKVDEFSFSKTQQIRVFVLPESLELYINDPDWGTIFKDRIFSL